MVDGEVFKVPLDRIQQRRLWSRSLTSKLVEAFKVLSLDRFRRSVLWSNSLTFLRSEVRNSLILALQAHPQFRVMSVGKGFFALFPTRKTVRSSPGRFGVERWRRSAHGRRVLVTRRIPPLMSSSLSSTLACCGCVGGTPIVHCRWGGPGGWMATIVIVYVCPLGSDVSVIMQRQFQQSFEFTIGPQILLFKVLDTAVLPQRRGLGLWLGPCDRAVTPFSCWEFLTRA